VNVFVAFKDPKPLMRAAYLQNCESGDAYGNAADRNVETIPGDLPWMVFGCQELTCSLIQNVIPACLLPRAFRRFRCTWPSEERSNHLSSGQKVAD
jgi:hypothetical protein